ncbi:unnamed protein product [Paramecium sonneborni]|uniref:Reactive oxygen species modulator 1 n=1 Tax=Paramecium sonneborni TaxID=65129 RepID=A0A8S1RHH4_9CILI|nr:unnamed protein product [Paramecium sonneborni]
MSGKEDEYEKLLAEQNLKDRLEAPQTETARQRKWRIVKRKFAEVQVYAKQGFIMGSLVGGGFGLVTGLWAAVQYKKLSMIPISVIVSGGSFGFIMACGSMIRNDELIAGEYQQHFKFNNQEVPIQQFWLNRQFE